MTTTRATGLREALVILNTYHKHLREEGQTEGPYWVSTNALLNEIAGREGKSIGDVAAEMRAEV
jgi:hypothetical protein